MSIFLRYLTLFLLGTLGGIIGNLIAALIEGSLGNFTPIQFVGMSMGIIAVGVLSYFIETGLGRNRKKIEGVKESLEGHRRELDTLYNIHQSGVNWNDSHVVAWLTHQKEIKRLKHKLVNAGEDINNDLLDNLPPPKVGCVTRTIGYVQQVATVFVFPVVFVVSLSVAFYLSPRVHTAYIEHFSTPTPTPSMTSTPTPTETSTLNPTSTVKPIQTITLTPINNTTTPSALPTKVSRPTDTLEQITTPTLVSSPVQPAAPLPSPTLISTLSSPTIPPQTPVIPTPSPTSTFTPTATSIPTPTFATFVFNNYTGKIWSVDIGPYNFELGFGKTGRQRLTPGEYTWQAHEIFGSCQATDHSDNKAFDFVAEAGKTYIVSLTGETDVRVDRNTGEIIHCRYFFYEEIR